MSLKIIMHYSYGVMNRPLDEFSFLSHLKSISHLRNKLPNSNLSGETHEFEKWAIIQVHHAIFKLQPIQNYTTNTIFIIITIIIQHDFFF